MIEGLLLHPLRPGHAVPTHTKSGPSLIPGSTPRLRGPKGPPRSHPFIRDRLQLGQHLGSYHCLLAGGQSRSPAPRGDPKAKTYPAPS